MKLLVVTQKVDKDDENLGFFHRWLEEFSRSFSKITVIANSVGQVSLPQNVAVYSLGKEKGVVRLKRVWRYLELFSHHYARSDAVFFHMIPAFVVLSSPFLISLRRRSVLWYVHKSITWQLRLAERLVDFVVTASDFSFRLPSKKVIYTGHAIDVDLFKPAGDYGRRGPGLHIITVGRVSPVKDIETIIGACSILKDNWGKQWSFNIVGGPLMERDGAYLASLKKMIQGRGLERYVFFQGPRPYTETPSIYRDHDMFISMSTTGSIDKAVLEAMASGLTVITANEAFQSLLPQEFFLEKRSPEFLAERIKALADENRPNLHLRELVLLQHSLQNTIEKVVDILQHGNSNFQAPNFKQYPMTKI